MEGRAGGWVAVRMPESAGVPESIFKCFINIGLQNIA
jgi:hypothetical protein